MKKINLISIVLSLFLLLTTSTAYAFNPFSGVDCPSAKSAAVCQDSSKKSTNVVSGGNGILSKITNLIALIAGIAAVVLIIFGSIELVVSGGSSDKVNSARRTIVYALIGLVIIVLAKLIVSLAVANG